MFDKQQRYEIEMELVRQKRMLAMLKRGKIPTPHRDPDEGDDPDTVFWQFVAGVGCQLVLRGNRLRGRTWPRPNRLGTLMIQTGQRLRRRALSAVKSSPCS